MERTEITRNQIVNQILKVGHGDLSIYKDIGLKAVEFEPELFAHLIAWNHIKGEVRDSKVALPVIALRGKTDHELYENAVAHLCLLDPRNLTRAIEFHGQFTKEALGQKLYPAGIGAGRILKNGIEKYIRIREANRGWWNKTAVQHRKSLKSLYCHYHIKPNAHAQKVLFKKQAPKGSIFEAIKNLKNMAPKEAAGTILNFKIPFLMIGAAVGGIKNKPDIILALIEQMSGAGLITNTNMLKRMGVFESPVLKSAYDSALGKVATDKKVSSLKISRAADTIKDKKLSKKLKTAQEDRLASLSGIDGDWLILGDKSGSMETSIKVSCQVSALIAKQVKGMVTLMFFDTMATSFDVTGKSYEEIKDLTKRIDADGGTSIGVGLDMALQKGLIVNGIAICSDGGENAHPVFAYVYKKYCAKFGLEPPVYLFHVPGDPNVFVLNCESDGIVVEMFELGHTVDYYVLPNLIQTLRTSRYTLVEEIMETALLTFKDVFK